MMRLVEELPIELLKNHDILGGRVVYEVMDSLVDRLVDGPAYILTDRWVHTGMWHAGRLAWISRSSCSCIGPHCRSVGIF